MAQGGGSAGLLLAVALLIVFVSQCSHAAGVSYKVGGANGWGLPKTNYLAKAPRFHAGDTLNFHYNAGAHDVVAVGSKDYKSCKVTGNSKRYTSGADQIQLKKGMNYFICSFAGHCASGMKIAIHAI